MLERLASGEVGVRCAPFDGRVVQETERAVVLVNEQEHGVVLQARHLPWRLALGPSSSADLRAEISAAARVELEQAFEATIHPATGEPVEPRTRDVTWSPVIELDELELDAPALWLLRRLHYVPTNELVIGTWLLPVADGLVSLSLMARDTVTGIRESALWLKHDEKLGGAPSAHPGQPFFDDAAHDALFPQHCLSRVRAARRWLEHPGKGGLTITKPAVAGSGEQQLPEADCAVQPPPRYARLPAGTLPMASTLVTFTRVTLGEDETPGMLNVWKLSRKLPRGEQGQALRSLAVDNAQGWESEGAKNIRVDARVSEGKRGPEARLHIQFEVDRPVQEAQVWFVDGDAIFRIGCSAIAAYDTQALWRDVDATLSSFRRLSPPKRPWWKWGSG